MMERSLMNYVDLLSENVAMFCAAVENDTHPLWKMPKSVFAINSSNLVAKVKPD